MEIAGKYLGVTVRYEEMVAILGWDPPSVARDFMIVGKVLGESPVGVWVMLEAISVGAPPENLFPDLPKEHPKRLVRWEFVRSAEVFDERPDAEQAIGFHG